MSYTTEQIALQQRFWDFCKSKGMNEKAISGAMGNISAECSWNLNLIEVGNGVGFGLFQWSYTRRTQLEAYGTDETHQFNFFWSELSGENLSTTGAEKQWIDAHNYTYSNYSSGTYSPTDSASAFCWCFERPAADTAHESLRQSESELFYTQFSGGGSSDDSDKVENAVKWMIDIANDNTHGYDQTNRWGPDYDCSSFVISGFEQAGIKLKTNGATYTGNMKAVCLSLGFKTVDWQNDSSKLVRGDILLNEVHHACVYIGNGQIVQASQNELGTTTGGQTGDQTGKEIYIRDYYVYSSGWDCVLRYGNGSVTPPDNPPSGTVGEVYKKIEATSYNVKQLSTEQITYLKTLSFNDKVKMKFTFNHNKRQIGKNYLGNKLTFDNKEYKIKDVLSNGYVILTNGENVCYKYLNPVYIVKI